MTRLVVFTAPIGIVLRAYSRHAKVGLGIKAEILSFLEGLQQAKALGDPIY